MAGIEELLELTETSKPKIVDGNKRRKMNAGLPNQFKKQHTKDNSKVNKNSLKLRIPKLHKSAVSQQVWTGKPVYSEEIKRIKNGVFILYESQSNLHQELKTVRDHCNLDRSFSCNFTINIQY